MTTTSEQIQELSAALDRDVEEAEQRAHEAEGNLARAQQECEQAKKAVLQARHHREGFRKTFAAVLSLEPESEDGNDEEEGRAAEETAETAAGNDNDDEEAADRYSRSLQLVPTKARAKAPALSEMTQKEQVRHVLGEKTLTLEELRAEMKALKLNSEISLGPLLSKSKDNVLDSAGQPKRDPKTGALLKQNTFYSPHRGSWRVTDVESLSGVLTHGEAKAEMHRRQMG